jgi:hypothetical protein
LPRFCHPERSVFCHPERSVFFVVLSNAFFVILSNAKDLEATLPPVIQIAFGGAGKV